MPDVRSLIETAQTRGLILFLEEGRVKIKAPQELDPESQALIQELRSHRDEIKSLLSQAGPPCWNCGATMTEARDIYGEAVSACWSCAKWA